MQNLSRMPIDAALAVFDWNVARQTNVKHLNWNPAFVRSQLVATARDGHIEIGTAKRLISTAQEPHKIKMMPTPAADTIKEQWNALKTVEGSSDSRKPPLSDTEQSLVESVVRVARADGQSGMTLEGQEVDTLSNLLRRILGPGSTIASDIHHRTNTSSTMGATLNRDEVPMLSALLSVA